MAQSEDTELRDLVIEALEKNGSLAKIRALLRANIFLIFEDECENRKQNVSLDKILSMPEGAICLSIVHEFLEFCNLKNTLFVYMSESRQRKQYVYEGQKKLSEKLNLPKNENVQEPILLTLLKQSVSFNKKKYPDVNDKSNENNFKDDQNCTYIVHEDSTSSATSTSHSDHSSDEKNKLHLRLQLDNSDTDTSSDSARDKTCSEYIANEHIITDDTRKATNSVLPDPSTELKHENYSNVFTNNRSNTNYLRELKLINNHSSSDSSSYLDLKPYNPLDQKLLNTTGVPIIEENEKETSQNLVSENQSSKSQYDENISLSNLAKLESLSSATLSSASLKNEEEEEKSSPKDGDPDEAVKSNVESPQYSNDFTSSSVNKYNDAVDGTPLSPVSKQENEDAAETKSLGSPHQTSQSSHSSVSISDVADLISEKSLSFSHHHSNNESKSVQKKYSSNSKFSNKDKSKASDDSAEFSESPIPSLSNLSLDIHSD